MFGTYPPPLTRDSRSRLFGHNRFSNHGPSVRSRPVISFPTALPILDALRNLPSRASAAAIGHHFVLNGGPPTLRIAGIDALAEMICDWSVAILEEAINDSTRADKVRSYALATVGKLLSTAIARGYGAVTKEECHQWMEEAQAEMTAHNGKSHPLEFGPVVELCSHLSQAVADGLYGQLPDF